MVAAGGSVRVPGAGAALEDLYLAPSAIPFAPTEPGNVRIPAGQTLDPNSAGITKLLVDAGGRSRAVISRECTIWETNSGHPFYSVLWQGRAVSYNGKPLMWRCPPNAVPGTPTDSGMILQDEAAHPQFGPQHRLRGWRVSVDHAGRKLNASNWSIVNYSRQGTAAPVWSTAINPVTNQPTATGCGREWVGLVRPEQLQWALANYGSISQPNVANLKKAIPHVVRGTFGMILHRAGQRYRAPALCSDASGSGLLEMGMRVRLDPAMTDRNILERRPAKVPPGTAPDGKPWADRWQVLLWCILFAVRDYGVLVADSTTDYLIVAQLEGDASAGWPRLLGPDTNPYYGEIIRDVNANKTDGGNRDAKAGIPLHRLQVPARSVY
jgi:hypothetical protein